MWHLKDKAYEVVDRLLRDLDPVQEETDQLNDVEAANVRDYLRMTGATWSTVPQIKRGTFLTESEIDKTIYRLRRNCELVTLPANGFHQENKYTTLERFHNEAPFKTRVLFALRSISN